MKLLIQDRYFGGKHFVWCAEQWDSGALAPYSFNARVPASSNPRTIHREMRDAVGDRHNRWRDDGIALFLRLGLERVESGSMPQADYDDMVVQLQSGDPRDWRPLVYIIPRDLVENTRLELVAAPLRAGPGPEWIIRDLCRSEFDIMEYDAL